MIKQTDIALRTDVARRGLGDERLCFEVPIYRCSEDQYADEMAKEKARCLGPLSRLREQAPRSYATAERRFDENEWLPWPYNETVGWIRISVQGVEIKGELCFVRAKKIKRGMSKRFQWAHQLFEIDVFASDSSAEIYKTICTELEKFRSERAYRKRHLDIEAFRNIGPFVDWQRLVNSGESNSGKQGSDLSIPEWES